MSTPTWPQRPERPGTEVLHRVLDAARQAVEPYRAAGADLELDLSVDPVTGAPVLAGTVPDWDGAVRAGHAAAGRWRALRMAPGDAPAVDVVVDVRPAHDEAAGPDTASTPANTANTLNAANTANTANTADTAGSWGAPPGAGGARLPAPVPSPPHSADAVVVGAGVCGLATARELVRRGLHVAVVDAADRIAGGASAWNNGMVHPGHDSLPGTRKAALNVAGNAQWGALAAELGLPFARTGSLVVAFDDDLARLDAIAARARRNAVPGAEVVGGDRARAIEPRLSTEVRAALWTPSTAMVDPAAACLAMADDIRFHGGTVVLGAAVERLLVADGRVAGVRCAGRDLCAPLVVNAAGVHADLLAATSGARRYSIHPRRGTLVLFDPGVADRHDMSVGPVPGTYSKGGGMTARPDGLTTGGPTAVEQRSRSAQPPAPDEIEAITALGRRLFPAFPVESAVHAGSAVRAATFGEDFVVGAAPGVPGLVDVAGTQSPGVASAPAIAAAVVAELAALGRLSERPIPFVPRARRAAAPRTVEEP